MAIIINKTQLANRKNKSEHYELLAITASHMNNKLIIDAGTFMGLSAAHLAVNPTNKVVTYDIDDKHLNNQWVIKPNIEFKKMPVINDLDLVLTSHMIFLDIDPHDGIQEKLLSDTLLTRKYTGVVIADDISLNQGMKDWWQSLPGIKIDLTDIGHFSGTGLWILPSTEVDVSII